MPVEASLEAAGDYFRFVAGKTVRFVFQGLAAYGTAEVVFSAQGYEDLRLPMVLRRTEIYANDRRSTSTVNITLNRGNAATLSLGLRIVGEYQTAARAGATISGELSATPSGVVTFDPVRYTFGPDRQSTEFRAAGGRAGDCRDPVWGGGRFRGVGRADSDYGPALISSGLR